MAAELDPEYDPEAGPPYTVPMKAVREGGAALEVALESLGRLQHDACKDLWQPGAKSPSESEDEDFKEALDWWQKHDGPEVRGAEKDAFEELLQSAVIPVGSGGRLAIAPPHVQAKYAASASAMPGHLLKLVCSAFRIPIFSSPTDPPAYMCALAGTSSGLAALQHP